MRLGDLGAHAERSRGVGQAVPTTTRVVEHRSRDADWRDRSGSLARDLQRRAGVRVLACGSPGRRSRSQCMLRFGRCGTIATLTHRSRRFRVGNVDIKKHMSAIVAVARIASSC